MQKRLNGGLVTKLLDRLRSAVIDRAYSYYQNGIFTRLGRGIQERQGSLVVIASSSEYTLSKRQYPIKSLNELKSLLNSTQTGTSLTQWMIGAWKGNGREVTRVEYKCLTLECLKRTKILIPEFLLLQQLESSTLYELQTPQHSVYASRIGNRTLTVLKGAIIHNHELARTALDLPPDSEITSLTWEQYQRHLHRLCIDVTLRNLLMGRLKKRATLRASVPVIPLATASAVLVVGYLGLTSVYLSQTKSVRQSQQDSYGTELTVKLQERAEIEELRSKLHALSDLQKTNMHTLLAMNLYAWLKAENVTPTRYAAAGDIVEFTAEVPLGTVLVTRLNDLPQIENVEFNAPVRRGSAGELVNLRIVLRELVEDSDAQLTDEGSVGG